MPGLVGIVPGLTPTGTRQESSSVPAAKWDQRLAVNSFTDATIYYSELSNPRVLKIKASMDLRKGDGGRLFCCKLATRARGGAGMNTEL